MIKCIIMIQMIIVTNSYLCVFEEYAFVVKMVWTCTYDLIPFWAFLLLVLSFWAIVYKILDLFYLPSDKLHKPKDVSGSLKIINFLDEFSQTIHGGYLDFQYYTKDPLMLFITWFIWFFITVFITMVLFNFLIANICASYYKVFSEKEKHMSLLKNCMNIKAMRLSSSATIDNSEGVHELSETVLSVQHQNLINLNSNTEDDTSKASIQG